VGLSGGRQRQRVSQDIVFGPVLEHHHVEPVGDRRTERPRNPLADVMRDALAFSGAHVARRARGSCRVKSVRLAVPLGYARAVDQRQSGFPPRRDLDGRSLLEGAAGPLRGAMAPGEVNVMTASARPVSNGDSSRTSRPETVTSVAAAPADAGVA
jgi:hypothetical protein